MTKLLKRRLLNQHGAMDRILVTLLLIIVGVGAMVGLSSWYEEQGDIVKKQATQKIIEAQKE